MTDDDSKDARIAIMTAEIERLRDIIARLEAEAAITRGSLALPPQPDEPATIVHDVPPNAPR
jgi:hypothetical protein